MSIIFRRLPTICGREFKQDFSRQRRSFAVPILHQHFTIIEHPTYRHVSHVRLDADMYASRQRCSLHFTRGFKYARRLEGRNIRLLRIELDTYKAPIRCNLMEASLDDPPPYEALSYAWGDPNITQVMICNDKPVQATVNLIRALRKIRLGLFRDSNRYRPSYLWVDSICINQEDTSERNSQVQLMRDVFADARRVLVWLGDKKINNKEMKGLIAAFGLVASKIKSKGSLEAANATWSWSGLVGPDEMRDLSTLTLSSWVSSMQDLGYPNPWRTLYVAFASDWYSRAWCLQEVYATRNPLMLYRNTQIDSDHLSLLCVWTTLKLVKNWHTMYSHASSADRRVLGRILEASQRWLPVGLRFSHPASILGPSKKLRATDPRDKVYGMLSLLDGIEPIEVDYKKSVEQVYIDSVLHTAAKGLCVLPHVFHPVKFHASKDWPSWLPRWDIQADKHAGPEELCHTVDPLSRPGGQRQVPIIDSDLARYRILRIKGLLCDRVTRCTEVLSRREDPVEIRKTSARRLFAIMGEHCRRQRSVETNLREHVDRNIRLRSLKSHSPTFDTPDELAHRANNLTSFLKAMKPEVLGTPDEEDLARATANANSLWKRLDCWRAFRTSNGWLGLGPWCMRPGDVVAVFDGGDAPYILRPVQDASKTLYHLMGECFIHNLTDGKAYEMIGQDHMVPSYLRGDCFVDQLAEAKACWIPERCAVEEKTFMLI